MKLRNQKYHCMLWVSAVTILSACQSASNIKDSATFDKNGNLNAVVEIPAGTNKKIEFNPETNKFETDKRAGKDRVIAFLPYPGNYGFVPSTLSDATKGGDGDPVDIIVISPSQTTGTILPVIPLAMLKLIDNGEEDFKIIAVPVDPNLNVLGVTTYEQLRAKKPILLDLIEKWFLNYDTEPAHSLGWANQEETKAYVKANLKTKQ